MRGDSAQLPVDFLVGFTIFIVSLIMVANFVPSLLVGLQRTSGIDYDAVAYRTGVVLVEDSGETYPAQQVAFPIGGNPSEFGTMDWHPWELRTDKDQVSRFGLALAKDTPNVLSINKINRFFGCTTFSYSHGLGQDLGDSDYRSKLLFSTYQYGYNITLQNLSSMKPGAPVLDLSIGEPYPAGYGYIRRYVLIKQNSNATQNLAGPYYTSFNTYTGGESLVCLQPDCNEQFTIHLNGTILYNNTVDTPFKIDLQREPLVINITGLSSLLNNSGKNPSPVAQNGTANWATLKEVDFGIPGTYNFWGTSVPGNVANTVSNGSVTGTQTLPLTSVIDVFDTLSLSMDYIDANYFGYGRDLTITFKFVDHDPTNPALPIPQTLIHGEYLYDYNRTNVTQPFLSTGMLEVGIW
jgi:hypothetical protein